MKWRPIETAPRDGAEILTYRGDGLMAVASYWQSERVWTISDGMDICNVTHWMPLPDAPNKDNTE